MSSWVGLTQSQTQHLLVSWQIHAIQQLFWVLLQMLVIKDAKLTYLLFRCRCHSPSTRIRWPTIIYCFGWKCGFWYSQVYCHQSCANISPRNNCWPVWDEPGMFTANESTSAIDMASVCTQTIYWLPDPGWEERCKCCSKTHNFLPWFVTLSKLPGTVIC